MKEEELMYKKFPKCPVCHSDYGYEFSGWLKPYAKCMQCGAKWLLHEWLSDKPMMELVEVSRDVERDTVVGYELLGRLYPIDFWEKIKVKKIRVKAEGVKEEQRVLKETRKVREETIPPKPTVSMPVILGIVLLFSMILVMFPMVSSLVKVQKAITEAEIPLIERGLLEARNNLILQIVGFFLLFVFLLSVLYYLPILQNLIHHRINS